MSIFHAEIQRPAPPWSVAHQRPAPRLHTMHQLRTSGIAQAARCRVLGQVELAGKMGVSPSKKVILCDFHLQICNRQTGSLDGLDVYVY